MSARLAEYALPEHDGGITGLRRLSRPYKSPAGFTRRHENDVTDSDRNAVAQDHEAVAGLPADVDRHHRALAGNRNNPGNREVVKRTGVGPSRRGLPDDRNQQQQREKSPPSRDMHVARPAYPSKSIPAARKHAPE